MNQWIVKIVALSFLVFLFNAGDRIAQADHHKHSSWDRVEDDDDDSDHDEEDEHFEADDEPDGQLKAEPTIPTDIKQGSLIWDKTADSDPADLPSVLYDYTVKLKFPDSGSTAISGLASGTALYVPLADVSPYLDAAVYWYPKAQIMEVKNKEKQLLFKMNKAVCYENGKKHPMPGKTLFANGTVYIPINVLIKGLGYTFTWAPDDLNTILLKKE